MAVADALALEDSDALAAATTVVVEAGQWRARATNHTLGLAVAFAVAVLLAVVALAASSPLGAAPAWADPAPTPAPAGGVNCPPEANHATDPGALLDKIVPGQGPADRPGCFPTSAYRIDYHTDSNPLGKPEEMMGWFTDFLFGLARIFVAVGLWLVEWVFTFGFAARLAQPAADIAARYQANMAAPLVGTALTLAAVYGGYHMLRGRLGRGVGEFGLSVLIVVLFATFIIARPKAFLDASLNTTGALSGSVVSLAVNCGSSCDTVALGRCPSPPPADGSCTTTPDQVSGSSDPSTNPDAAGPPVPGSSRAEYVFDQYRGLIRPLERGIHQAFIEQPYEFLQWGQAVPAGECRHRMNEILAKSPGGNRNAILHIMANGQLGKDTSIANTVTNPVGAIADAVSGDNNPDGTCDDLYQFNRTPTMERLVVAALALVAATTMMVLLVLVAATIIAAQLLAVALLALTPFAALAGALPGAGRQGLWRWVASFFKAMLAILLMSAFLAFLLVTAKAVFDTTTGDFLIVRMAALDLVTALAFVVRKRMLAAGHRMATNLGQRLGSASVGGHRSSWMAPAAVGGATGFAMARQLRENFDGAGSQWTRTQWANRQRGKAYAKALRTSGMGGGGVGGGAQGGPTHNDYSTATEQHLHIHIGPDGRFQRDPGRPDRDNYDDDEDIVDAEIVEDRELPVGAGSAAA